MKNIIKALQLKAELDNLRPLDQEREAIVMQKLRLDWNYHSNHLEGNTLTYGETKALLLHGITAQGKPLKDHLEITGHNEALLWIIDLLKGDYPLTENFIRQIHQLLLKENFWKEAITPDGKSTKRLIKVGEYKTTPNHVKTVTGEIFRFATPEETPSKMYDLINWYREKLEDEKVNAIILAAEFHYRFIRIHPFDDGNGRTARILMNFILMRFGFPPAVVKTEDKESYFSVLRQADAGNIEPFIDYIAKNIVRSLEIMIAGAKGENIEEPDDIDKQIKLLEYELKVQQSQVSVFKTPETLMSIYENTIKRLFAKMIQTCEKFDRLYSSTKFSIFERASSLHRSVNKRDYYNEIKNKIEKNNYNIEDITFIYFFRTFKNGTIGFDFYSIFEIKFLNQNYTISNQKTPKIQITKQYNQQLTDEEIDKIVNDEAKRHLQFIEQEIKKSKN